MKTIVSLLAAAIMVAACSRGPKDVGTWKYDHELTKEAIDHLYQQTGKQLSEKQLDKTVVHFKNHPPELELKNGTFKMVRLVKTSGDFSGTYQWEGNKLKLLCGGEDCGWDVTYNEDDDTYTVVFMIYPIVLSR